MWKLSAFIFFGLTLSPGVLVLLVVAITRRPDDLDGGTVCAVLWLLVVVALVCSGIRSGYVGALRADRRARGLCTACGYNLRASGHRCPECGANTDRVQRNHRLQ
jgi:hypothetical protein